jgi:hypothetical protein
VRPGLGGDGGEPVRLDDPLVGVTVRHEQQRRAGLPRDAPGLLQPAQQPAGQIRHPARAEPGDRVPERRLVRDRPRRHDDLSGVVEYHNAKPIGRVEAIDERHERALRRLQALTGHRAAAIQHDLHGGGRPRHLLRRFGRAHVQKDGQLVGLLDGDQLDVDMGVQLHRVLRVVAGIEDGSSPPGDL